jgi:general stress protein YciG
MPGHKAVTANTRAGLLSTDDQESTPPFETIKHIRMRAMPTSQGGPPTKKTRGFASMSPERRQELARKGGKSVPVEKRAFSVNHSLAASAGRKGGIVRRVPEEAPRWGKKSHPDTMWIGVKADPDDKKK